MCGWFNTNTSVKGEPGVRHASVYIFDGLCVPLEAAAAVSQNAGC